MKNNLIPFLRNLVVTSWLLFLSLCSFAKENGASTVIDLGEISVEGELRKPAITWIDSKKAVNEVVPSLFESEFDSFEHSLLSPTQDLNHNKNLDLKPKLDPEKTKKRTNE